MLSLIVISSVFLIVFFAISRIMGSEGLFDLWRRTRYFEKPYKTRRRLNFERTKAIYDEDMRRKINFVMRVNRRDPWLGRGPLADLSDPQEQFVTHK